ncbi:MAG: DUF1588 domain-containing protein [Bdellovibrionales bacterium]|nr:DUF1588 domain-containing protein [Bdellovibrionales bacterium]
MKIFFLCLTLLLSHNSQSQAKESIGPFGVLEKASRRLRQNQLPSPSDYAELELAIAKGETENFLDSKILSYTKSDRFAYGMTFRLLEDFEMLTSGNLGRDVWRHQKVPPYGERPDTLSLYFYRMAKENRSWDSLLTGTEYEIPFYDKGVILFSQGRSDADFLEEVLGNLAPRLPEVVNPRFAPTPPVSESDRLKPALPVIKRLQFPEKTPFVAGAITTARFFERYTNVAINKNRRRAAALFKIFLCDPMVPAIENGTDKKHEYLIRAFPTDWALSAEEIRKTLKSDADVHGKDAQCFACHYKLDPAGQTFQAIGLSLSSAPASGALIYKNSRGVKVDLPVSGLNELGRTIADQEDYVTCQVRKFWKWFVGADVPLEEERLQQLARIFNHMNHQPQDFAAYLTRTEEFRTIPKRQERIGFPTVRPFLNRCDSCHYGIKRQKEGSLPQFASAFAQLLPAHRPWLVKMKERMERTDIRRMPMDWQSWKDDDLVTVRIWIQQSINDLPSEEK